MADRYSRRAIKNNQEELYDNLFESRGVKSIRHYTTPVFPQISARATASLIRERYVWKTGDSYQRLAESAYGDARYWWVIAWYNQKPTDGLIKNGDVISVPFPLQDVIELLGA